MIFFESPTMANLKPRLLGAVFLSLLAFGCSPQPEVAVVGDESIRLDEFDRQLRILKSLRPGTVINEITRRQVLEQMAKQLLLTQEARKAGLDKDPAAKEALARQHEAVKKELQESIRNAQAQLEQLDRAVEQKVLIEQLLKARRGALTVSEKEIKEAYKLRQEQSGPSTPPLMQVRDQVIDQVLVEKLVEQSRQGVKVELFLDAASGANGGL